MFTLPSLLCLVLAPYKNGINGVIEVHAEKLSKQETFDRMLFPLYELEHYDSWVDDSEHFLLNQTSGIDKVRKIRRIIDKRLRHIWDVYIICSFIILWIF